jgi:hypothetical protein
MKTDERGKAVEAKGEFPSVGENAAEMVGTMNMIVRSSRDQGQEDTEADGGPVHKEDFLQGWSNVEYCNHAATRQEAFDMIYEGADRLIADATPSDEAELGKGEEVTWQQTQALIQGTFDLTDKLSEAGFRYKARNKSKAWEVDTGWYPTGMGEPMEYPGHAVNKLTRPYQWLRREAISNLRTMQALGRPRMTRKVLMPWQDEEPESSTGSDDSSGSDAEAPSPMQGIGIISKEGTGDDVNHSRKVWLAEILARYHAACYVETPWHESERALAVLTQWFTERTMEWVVGECIQAGIIMDTTEAGTGKPPPS